MASFSSLQERAESRLLKSQQDLWRTGQGGRRTQTVVTLKPTMHWTHYLTPISQMRNGLKRIKVPRNIYDIKERKPRHICLRWRNLVSEEEVYFRVHLLLLIPYRCIFGLLHLCLE